MKNLLIGLLIVLILGGGLVVGIILIQQKAIFNQKAATPTGKATVSISPATSTFQRNNPYTISVYFNTSGISTSGVTVRLTYSNLSVAASGIQINPTLLSSGEWTCPVKTVSNSGSTGQIDINCINNSAAGFSSNTDTLLATFNLTASQVPVQNPLILSFDPQNSMITQKSDNTDILLTPTSTGSYTIADTVASSPTATPLLVVSSPTATPVGTLMPTTTPTATPTLLATSTPTSTASATPLATQAPIPVTGFDAPTIIGGAAGVLLLLVGAAVLII